MSRQPRVPLGTQADAGLAEAVGAWQAVVAGLDAVDAVTNQLLRLRCAAFHDCRATLPLPGAGAADGGLDEVMAQQVLRYEASDLSERHKVALRLADALMSRPGEPGPDLARELREHFRPEQVLELTLHVMQQSCLKVPVALGTDNEVAPAALSDLIDDVVAGAGSQ